MSLSRLASAQRRQQAEPDLRSSGTRSVRITAS